LGWTRKESGPSFSGMANLPPALEEIVSFFSDLSEPQRRDALLAYAAEAPRHQPRDEETYSWIDERIDPGCMDVVGIFLRVDETGNLISEQSWEPETQTLTKALVSILCRGLEKAPLASVVSLHDDFITEIIGAQLMRARGRTVYHVMRRMRDAAQQIA